MATRLYNADGYINYTPSSAVTAGDVVVQGSIVGVADSDIAANKLGALSVEGVYQLAAKSADDLTIGLLVYWDDSEDEVTLTSTSNEIIGRVTVVAGAGVVLVSVLLAQA